MDDGGGNGGGSFRVKRGSNAAEVADVHEAGAGEVGDVVGERELRIKSNTKTADRGIRGESSRRRVIRQLSIALPFTFHTWCFPFALIGFQSCFFFFTADVSPPIRSTLHLLTFYVSTPPWYLNLFGYPIIIVPVPSLE